MLSGKIIFSCAVLWAVVIARPSLETQTSSAVQWYELDTNFPGNSGGDLMAMIEGSSGLANISTATMDSSGAFLLGHISGSKKEIAEHKGTWVFTDSLSSGPGPITKGLVISQTLDDGGLPDNLIYGWRKGTYPVFIGELSAGYKPTPGVSLDANNNFVYTDPKIGVRPFYICPHDTVDEWGNIYWVLYWQGSAIKKIDSDCFNVSIFASQH